MTSLRAALPSKFDRWLWVIELPADFHHLGWAEAHDYFGVNPGRLPGKANRAPAAIEAGEYLIGGMGIEHG